MLGSFANPHGIDGLRLFRSTLGLRRGRLGLRLSWDALTHPLYRGDLLSAGIGRSLSPLPLALAARCSVLRSAVKGFPAGYSVRLEAGAVVTASKWAFALRTCPAGGGRDAPVAFCCSADLGPLAVALSGGAAVEGASDIRAAALLTVDETLSLSIGYRVDTDELCYGLICRRRRLLVTVGWRDHPILGRTGDAGVGWIWQR
jgi:hypothetical protein